MNTLDLPIRKTTVGHFKVGAVWLPLFVVSVALVLGLATAVAAPIAALLMLAAVGVVAAFVMPIGWMLMLQLVLAAVVAGSVQYFLGISQVLWLPYLLGVLLLVRAFAERMSVPAAGLTAVPATRQALPPLFAWLLALYLVSLAISYVINRPSVAETIVSAKNYLFMWGVLAAFFALRPFWPTVHALWRAVIWIACLQLPVVLYQKLFVAAGLSNAGGRAGLSWDAISGTFGGSTLGGHSGVMALFIVMALALAWIRMREGMLKVRYVLLLVCLTLPSLLLAEVKAAIVWLIVAGGIVFGRELRRRPAVALAGLLAGVLLAGTMVLVYRTSYYERSADTAEVLKKWTEYVFDTNEYRYDLARLGRVTSLVFWRQQNEPGSVHGLFGHGPGASRSESTVAVGNLAKQYFWALDTHAASTLLWDVGLVGCLSFALALVMAAIAGLRLSRDARLAPERRVVVEVAGIGLLLIASTLAYTGDAVGTPVLQFATFFMLAVIARARSESRQARAQAGA